MNSTLTKIFNLVTTPTPDKRIKHAIDLGSNLTGMDQELVFAFAVKRRPDIGLTSDEIKSVEPVAKQYELVHAGLMEFVSETPRASVKRQRKELIGIASQGDAAAVAKLREIDAWDLTDFEEEARQKRMAYKSVLRGFSASARELLKPAISRRITGLLDWMDDVEMKERREAAEAGAPFVASGPLRVIAWLASSTVNIGADGFGQNPRQMLRQLGYLTPEEKKAAEEKRKVKTKADEDARAKATLEDEAKDEAMNSVA